MLFVKILISVLVYVFELFCGISCLLILLWMIFGLLLMFVVMIGWLYVIVLSNVSDVVLLIDGRMNVLMVCRIFWMFWWIF